MSSFALVMCECWFACVCETVQFAYSKKNEAVSNSSIPFFSPFFIDFVHIWDHTSLPVNLLESPLRARTAVLVKSSRQEYLILALRLNRSASI